MNKFDRPKCREGQIQVMIMGVYHMESSKRHIFNTEVDDVLTPKRQHEIERLVENLSKWKPDIIAVEFPHDKENELNAVYQEYVKGIRRYDREEKFSLHLSSRNEIVQIGFRLAQYLNHDRILALDWFPEYPEWITEDMIKEVMYYKPHLTSFDPEKMAKEQSKKLKELSIPQYLYWLNSEPQISFNDAMMFSIALEHENKKAAFAIISNWFVRNLGIVRNLKGSILPGIKRVFLLYGAGHVPILRYIMEISPLFCPVSPLPYLKNEW
jgi:hypothetical protein